MGFISVGSKVQRFNSVKEFERIVKESRPKLNFTLTSTEDDYEDDLAFEILGVGILHCVIAVCGWKHNG